MLTKNRVCGSTLFESQVAMVIVLLSFAGVATIFVKVSESSNNQQRTIAISIIDQYLAEAEKVGNHQNDEYQIRGMTLIRKIEKYGNVEMLKMSTVKVKAVNGKILAERRDLIIDE